MADSRNRDNVIAGVPNVNASGGLLIGKVVTDTSKFPTSATSELDSALEAQPAGFITQDGITKTVERSTEDIKDWNGDLVKTLETEHNVSLKFTFMEGRNAAILKVIAGEGNVTASGENITVKERAGELPHFSLIAELAMGEKDKGRIFAPDCQVVSVGDVTYQKSGVIQYEVEVKCFTDQDNVKLYGFMDKSAD